MLDLTEQYKIEYKRRFGVEPTSELINKNISVCNSELDRKQLIKFMKHINDEQGL